MTNIAVIGVGYWGPNLVRSFSQIKEAKIHTVCDLREDKLNFIKSQYPSVIITKNFNDILKNSKIEAVVIALPARLHYKFTKMALLAGKHVLVEKPLTTKVAHAKELIKLAENAKKILMVGSTFLYNDAVRKIKEYIDRGDLGEIYHIYFQRLNWGRIRQDVNAMWNLAPHDISMALYWLGEKPIKVFARGMDYLQSGIEDIVFLDLEFKNKKSVHIHSSWLDPSKVRRAVIIGSKKKIIYDDVSENEKIQIYTTKTNKKFTNFTTKVFVPKIKFREPLLTECSHFVDCIKKNKRPLTDGKEGLEIVKVLEVGQKSLKILKPVIYK